MVVIVICSFRLGWVTPHRRNDGQDSEWPVRQAPMRSLRPTGWCRGECPSRADESPSGQSERTSAGVDGVRPGSGTHPHADHFSFRSGGPSAGYLKPRCRVGACLMPPNRESVCHPRAPDVPFCAAPRVATAVVMARRSFPPRWFGVVSGQHQRCRWTRCTSHGGPETPGPGRSASWSVDQREKQPLARRATAPQHRGLR